MKETEPVLDETEHLPWSDHAGKVMREALESCCPRQAEELWDRLATVYAGFLADQPPLGGRKNFQAGSVYDCIALFALYEVLPEKPTLEEFQALVEKLFVPDRKLPPIANWNFGLIRRAGNCIWASLAKKIHRHEEDWPGNYRMESEPYDPAIGPRYKFYFCPIADFARRHGYQHLMPAMCNPDYPTMAALHAVLIRSTTCANGDCCDYWFVGDKDPRAAQYPRVTDRDGFWVNPLPDKDKW